MSALTVDSPSELIDACPKCHGVKWATSKMCGQCSNPRKWHVASEGDLKDGVVVNHEEYGIGTVLRWAEEGVVVIRFPGHGVKKIEFIKAKFKVFR